MRIMDRFPKSKNERVCFWEILFPVDDLTRSLQDQEFQKKLLEEYSLI